MSDTTNIFEQRPDMDTVGGRLSRAREASGLSMKQLAWRLGVTIATVKGWESDRSQPSSHRLATVSGLLQVSLSWILHGVGIGPSEELGPDEGFDEPSRDMTDRLAQIRLLHVETGLLIEKLKGEFDRMAAVR